MNGTMRVVCSRCGSESVRRDAYAEWDSTTQRWELAAVFDQGYCDECGGEAALSTVPMTGGLPRSESAHC